MIATIVKTLIKIVGAKNTAKAITSKPIREVTKKVIKSEIKKKLR